MTPTDRPLRFVTAASLFDGHDAAITIMRRILQARGAEVIHLGHDRSVQDVVSAVIEEAADGVAVSSYQGGHVEYFRYLAQQLDDAGAGHVRIFGGGGGVIVPAEIALLAESGVRIFSPEDGQRLGLVGMIDEMLQSCRDTSLPPVPTIEEITSGDERSVGAAMAAAQDGRLPDDVRTDMTRLAATRTLPVLGITGTGGSGKSSLTDELVRRLRVWSEGKLRIGVLAVDPTRARSGGALLGDRIRMNMAGADGIFMHSLATRGTGRSLPEHMDDVVAIARCSGWDLLIIETPGIGQGDSDIAPWADVSLYVMTPEFGAATQLEKIDMLDYADVVAINKIERRGGQDALRDVARQLVRNRGAFGTRWEDMPVFGTSAAHFADPGVDALTARLVQMLHEHGLPMVSIPVQQQGATVPSTRSLVPAARERYLSDVAEAVRHYHQETARQARLAHDVQSLERTAELLGDDPALAEQARREADKISAQIPAGTREQLSGWPQERQAARAAAEAWRTTPSGTALPRLGLPSTMSHGDLVRYLRSENLPGHFPFTAGVFALKRDSEAPTRMFAGEGDPGRTNRRFHLLSEGQPATRLSTAFDSVTLYGRDPSTRPDVYGKVGTSGVSIATLDDMRDLFAGFDLCDPATSVSMTINGPAPTLLAMFFVNALDQQRAKTQERLGRALSASEQSEVDRNTLSTIRGTVQADILKEDQGQNTCIFSTDFSLRCMADVQEWFIAHGVRQFYSVSISGYHIAEAGANPITQLAFTLANAFTYVEAYRARGMDVDDFAPNFSFFFSNGMDAEYTVIGRVARRIWAVAMRDLYGAGTRSQKLKYHIQTSGRSLHAQEMSFNDIRTTLQALCAYYDHCNSLHTNAYDEAVTTPTDESVRRAMAIQLIINQEWGLAATDNPLQGSYVVSELTDLVEAAVLAEFDRLTERGGVLGAMETGYQRGLIQDESMLYEERKHDGSLPIVGVNTFQAAQQETAGPLLLSRATEAEKESQIQRLADFHERHRAESGPALAELQRTARESDNVFAALMDAVRHCSLGQITQALFEVGGQYRRSM